MLQNAMDEYCHFAAKDDMYKEYIGTEVRGDSANPPSEQRSRAEEQVKYLAKRGMNPIKAERLLKHRERRLNAAAGLKKQVPTFVEEKLLDNLHKSREVVRKVANGARKIKNKFFSDSYDFANNRTIVKREQDVHTARYRDAHNAKISKHKKLYGEGKWSAGEPLNNSAVLWEKYMDGRSKLSNRLLNNTIVKENGGKLLSGEDINRARAARKRAGQIKSGIFPGGKGPNARPENKPKGK